MDENQKQLIYIGDIDTVEKQKRYIHDNLNFNMLEYFLIISDNFNYIGWTSFSKPIVISDIEYNNLISDFKNLNFSLKEKEDYKRPSLLYELNKLSKTQQLESCDLRNIHNNKLLKHKTINIHKTELVKYLKNNKKIYLSDTNYKDLIFNDHLPYLDYDDLKQDLKILYQDEKFEKIRKCEKKLIFDQLSKAIGYAKKLSENKINFILLVVEKNLYIIYHPETEIDTKEETTEDYKEIIEILFGEELENIINKKLSLCNENEKARDFDFVNGLDNYIIDNINCDYKISLNGHKNNRCKNTKIDNKDIDFDIVFQYKQLCQIIIKYKNREIKLKEDFYLPGNENNLDRMANSLNLLWVNGHLMSDYDYNFYMKYDKILFNDIRLPKWFNCKDNKELNNLFKFIEQLK